MAAPTAYDRLGRGYTTTRRPDPRFAAAIHAALGDAASVINVGAGTGAYEPTDRPVVGVEPSAVMIAQRPPGAAPVVEAFAEDLPFPDASFDAALASMTVHHWRDFRRGMTEMLRVARRRVVVFTFDPAYIGRFWLVRDYLPAAGGRHDAFPSLVDQAAALGGAPEVVAVPVPHDCQDGVLGAFWRRPEAYLDPRVRAGISTFADLDAAEMDPGLRQLAADLRSGAWRRRHRELLSLEEVDLGYRLLVARPRAASRRT